ncbi:MAG: hypothetical protein JWP81_976 [Ferruginibacter sp.]|nr:hypothetical protein [Ferruginibacter sp.]
MVHKTMKHKNNPCVRDDGFYTELTGKGAI